ncbi:hypothetical protein Q9L58_008565 [Maublancomyces gigas]|uniref:Rhodopsin domain-containing protein n=1 Tax=Discina gigas TaxID=1032678 RepID=A0ABR3G9C8_9PEZI
MVLSTAFVLPRLYVRKFVSNSFGLDDCAATIALILLLAVAAIDISGIRYGLGRHVSTLSHSERQRFFNFLPVFQSVWFHGIFFTRLSVLLFIRRLVTVLKGTTMIWIAVGLLTLQHCIFFAIYFFQCRPFWILWNRGAVSTGCIPLSSARRIVFVHSGFGIFCDIALFVVPMVFAWRNLPTSGVRFRVTLLLSLGSFACIAGIIRLATMLQIDLRVDPTWEILPGHLWTQLECNTGLIVSCFPALNSVFRQLKHRILGAKTETQSAHGGAELYAVGPESQVEMVAGSAASVEVVVVEHLQYSNKV